MAADIEEVKTTVRAILETRSRVVPLLTFLEDYKSEIGYDLPFQRFGFTSALPFLRNLKDTVILSEKCGRTMIESVTSESTKHIVNLVSGQKQSSKPSALRPSYYEPRHPVGRPTHQRSFAERTHRDYNRAKPSFEQIPSIQKPLRSSCQVDSVNIPSAQGTQSALGFCQRNETEQQSTVSQPFPIQTPTFSTNSYTMNIPQRQCIRPVPTNLFPHSMSALLPLPAMTWTFPTNVCTPNIPLTKIMTDVWCFLAENKFSVALRDFNAFYARFGYSIQPRLYGCQTLAELLGMFGFLKLRNSGKELRILLNDNFARLVPTEPVLLAPSNHSVDVNSVEQTQNQNRSEAQPSCEQPPPPPVYPAPSISPSRFSSSAPKNPRDCESPFVSVTDNEDNGMAGMDCKNLSRKPSDKIPDKMIAIFQKILALHPSGLFLMELSDEYKKITGHPLDFKECGFHSLLELVSKIPRTFKLSKKSRNKWQKEFFITDPLASVGSGNLAKDFCVTGTTFQGFETTKTEKKPVEVKRAPPIITVELSPFLKRRIMQVVCSCPFGINLEDFEHNYKVFFQEEFSACMKTSYSLEAIFLSLKDLVSVKYDDQDQIKIHVLPEGRKLLTKPKADMDSFISFDPVIPSDAVGEFAVYSLQQLPSDLKSGDYLQVKAAYVSTPSKFYVQIRGIHTSEALNALMNDLCTVYEGRQNKQYVMPKSLIAIGRPCVAIYPCDNHWYRATISAIRDKSTVEVHYVDYGNTNLVSVDQIRLIKKDFMRLPSQAFLSRLHAFVPVCGEYWSIEATKLFKSLVMDKPLVSCVIEFANRSLSLLLCDTNGDNDIHIQDVLAAKGHARVKSLEPTFKDARLPRTHADVAPIVEQHFLVDSGLSGINTLTDGGYSTFVGSGYSPTLQRVPAMIEAEGGRKYPQTEKNSLEYEFMRLPLMEHSINVVYMNRGYYVPSFEISKFMWSQDLLSRTLKTAGYKVSNHLAEHQISSKLYTELLSLNEMGVNKSSKLVLYPVEEVPKILEAVGKYRQNIATIHEAFKFLSDMLLP